ncbi:hypothetical protein [Marinospirillum alkaliphilum]|nr:hypothetical protein [Marinospirillum alkaliphilum]
MPIFLIVLIVLNALLCLFFASMTYERALLPYDELGRYFDGQIVWHEQAAGVYALISTMLLALTLVMTCVLVKKIKYKESESH